MTNYEGEIVKKCLTNLLLKEGTRETKKKDVQSNNIAAAKTIAEILIGIVAIPMLLFNIIKLLFKNVLEYFLRKLNRDIHSLRLF